MGRKHPDKPSRLGSLDSACDKYPSQYIYHTRGWVENTKHETSERRVYSYVHLRNSVLSLGALTFHHSDNYRQIILKQYLSSRCEM